MLLRHKIFPTLLVILATLTFWNACQRANYPLTIKGITMGTVPYLVKIAPPAAGKSQEYLAEKVREVLARIDRKMSTYRDDSEVSRFNRYRKTDWFAVSQETAEVVHIAQQISQASKGAFDITVGPLVNLWGFGSENVSLKPPSESKIAAIQQQVGYQKLQVDKEKFRLKKQHPELAIDLSAIAKGYAVDALAKMLDKQQLENYMIEVGGEVRSKGKIQGRFWHIGIEAPVENRLGGQRFVQKVVALENQAMATSGDYRNYRYLEEGKTKVSHTIDPRTGRPVTHKLASVSVIAKSCTVADAWATALMVLGKDKGAQLAEEHNLACYLITRNDNKQKFHESKTQAFIKLFESK